eukprot:13852198-Alexandrium_andersonii.AAC.1
MRTRRSRTTKISWYSEGARGVKVQAKSRALHSPKRSWEYRRSAARGGPRPRGRCAARSWLGPKAGAAGEVGGI